MNHSELARRVWIRRCAAALLSAGAVPSVLGQVVESRSCPIRRRARTIIWQPWSSHADMADAAWRRLGQVARREGYDRVLVQWCRIGNVDFWPTEGSRWMKSGMSHWRGTGLRLVLGLYMGPDYYRVLEQSNESLQEHLDECLARSIEVAGSLRRHPPPLAIDAWYLPQEVDDLNWPAPEREAMLRKYMTNMREALVAASPSSATARPVYVSAFFSGATPPAEFAVKLLRLHRQTGVVWIVQGGLGTGRLSEDRTAEYLRTIARVMPPQSWGGLLEVFDQREREGQPPTFEPAIEAVVERRKSVWCASTGQQPLFTFSLNQRVALLDNIELRQAR